MIAHVVLFTPRPELSPDERDGLVTSLERACAAIPQLRRVRIGRRRMLGYEYDALFPVSFEFVAVMEFESEVDLRVYLEHPAHADLGRRFRETSQVALAHDFALVENARDLLLDD